VQHRDRMPNDGGTELPGRAGPHSGEIRRECSKIVMENQRFSVEFPMI
jgi:hypothetical protein